jgi:anthranilate synthase component 1
MEMCIAIRTLMARKGRVSAQSGAGIVYDSVPEAEYQETVNKARAVFTAVAQAEERLLAGRGEGASVRAERRRRGAAAGSRGSRAAAARSRSLRGKGSRR